MTDQAAAVEPSPERSMWIAVAIIAIILVVLGAVGVTTRRSRTRLSSDAVGQA
jgi:hypothetical protein